MNIENGSCGYIYLLKNEMFDENWHKIIVTPLPLDYTSLSRDNLPISYTIALTIKTIKYRELVTSIKGNFQTLSKVSDEYFLNVKMTELLDFINSLKDLIDDLQIDQGGLEPINKKRRPRFRFSMVGIKSGEYITFIYTQTKVRVASDRKVEYKGNIYTLSELTRILIPDSMKNTSGSYQGSKYFSYNGILLEDLRDEVEARLK